MKRVLLLVALCFAMSFVGQATTITYAPDATRCGLAPGPCLVVTPPQDLDNGLATTAWTHTLVYPKFDPSLGTLNSITFRMFADVDSYYRVENRSTTATTNFSSFNIVTSVRLRRADLTQLLLVQPIVTLGAISLTTYDGITDYAGTSGFNSGPRTAAVDGTVVTTALADLAAHTGVGNVSDWNIRAETSFVSSGGGGLRLTQTQTTARSFLNVTYDYTPFEVEIPEPGTALAAGVALLLLGGLGQRRFRC